jgi:hypothetical protein
MTKPRRTHTTFYTGAKIRIIMRTGEIIVAKFKERLGHKKIRTDKGDYWIVDIRAINYFKPLPHERR